MRVTVNGQPGTFVGLLAPDFESDTPSAVVRMDDGPGLFLTLHHPSRVRPVNDAVVRALRSLATGVHELQDQWPLLESGDGMLNDLCGFLFATLPLADEALGTSRQLPLPVVGISAQTLDDLLPKLP